MATLLIDPAQRPRTVGDLLAVDEAHTLSRRTVIKGIAFVSAGALMPAAFVRAVFAEEPGGLLRGDGKTTQQRVLVVLQLGGGNDGLNTVIPYTDGAYYAARPGLGIKAEQVLRLDDRYGLHPSMTGIKALYDRGLVAIVQGAGYPDPNRSHFRAMDIWHSASTAEHLTTGWIGRLLDATAQETDTHWRAANVGSAAPLSLLGERSFVPSLESVPAYVLQTDPRYPRQADRRVTDWAQLYAQQAAWGGKLALLSHTGLEAYRSTVELQAASGAYTPRATYPQSPLSSALRTVAQLITSGLGTGVAYVTTGGFDTHARQTQDQGNMLGTVSDAVRAFYDDLDAHGRTADVTTLAWTEFGRRVHENGSGGTDHGTATPVFLFGGGVRGGLYGDPPSVAALDGNGDLRFTTDFRSVYATVLERWFAVDPALVLGARYPVLGLWA